MWVAELKMIRRIFTWAHASRALALENILELVRKIVKDLFGFALEVLQDKHKIDGAARVLGELGFAADVGAFRRGGHDTGGIQDWATVAHTCRLGRGANAVGLGEDASHVVHIVA